MTLTRDEYNRARQNIISDRRSLRMKLAQASPADKPDALKRYGALPVTPPLLPDVYGYELIGPGNTYEGFTLDEDEAKEAAETSGWTVKRKVAQMVGHLPFDAH